MSRRFFNRTAALIGLLFAVSAAALSLASPPAFADGDQCCQVSIDDMPGQFHSGDNPQPFTLHVVNQTRETLRYLNVSFVLQANGLVGDLVHLQRQRVPRGQHNVGTFTQHGVHSGIVTATDQIDFGALALPPGGGVNIQYQLSFSKKLSGTGLTLSIQVQPKHSDGGVSMAGPYQSTIVAAGQSTQTQPDPVPTPTPTATISDTPSATDATGVGAAPTDQASLNDGSAASGDEGSLTWLAYTVGALLLLGGVGVFGTLLWRRGSHEVEGEPQQYDQPTYPTAPAVYGAPGRHAPPTAQFPMPQDPLADPQTWVGPATDRS